MQLRFARSLAPRSMAAAEDITAVLREFEEEVMAEQAEAQPTAENDATATTASPPTAAAAGATATADEPSSDKKPKGGKKKKATPEKAGGGEDDAEEAADGDAAAVAPTQPWVAPSAGGGSDSGGASSGAAASKKKKKKKKKKKQPKANKEEEEAQPERASRRKKGEAALAEADLDDLKRARKASKASTKGKAPGGKGALGALALAASGAGDASAGGQGDGDEEPGKIGASNRKDLKPKAGHNNHANQKHASSAWEKYSPTGLWLGEEFCAENFDHSGGRPWAVAVFNAVTQKVPRRCATANGTRAPRTSRVSTRASRARSSSSRALHRSRWRWGGEPKCTKRHRGGARGMRSPRWDTHTSPMLGRGTWSSAHPSRSVAGRLCRGRRRAPLCRIVSQMARSATVSQRTGPRYMSQ